MESKILLTTLILMIHTLCFAQRVENFQLQDAVSGQSFSLADHQNSKAVVLVFTVNSCPFSKLYEDRIVKLNQQFSKEGFVFAMVNPHTTLDEEESTELMKKRASENNFGFPYLIDDKQTLTRQLQITKLPEVVVISPSPTGFAISYRGAIDNNPQMAANASIKYLENALSSIQNNKNPSPSSSRAVGCNVKLLN
jgi:peroxiredoxin